MSTYKNQFVLNLLAYGVQRNVSPEELCALAGLDLKLLKGKSQVEITETHLLDLWQNAIHLTDDPVFGLHFGESMQLSALGVVGQIIQSSNTVGEALQYAAKSIGFITELVSMEVIRRRNRINIHFSPRKGTKDAYTLSTKQFIDFFMVFTIHELDGLVLRKVEPLKVTTKVNLKDYVPEFERVLRCRPKTSQKEFSIEFSSQYWNEPIITANYQLQQLMLEMETSIPSKKNSLLSKKVAGYLQTNAYLGTATIEQIAANFNYTPRTLQRRLHEEGVTFQQLTDEVRKSLALQYMTYDNHSVKEIAFMLGYNDVSAFSRAFKRWTGKTPGFISTDNKPI